MHSIETSIGYTFADKQLLRTSFTHSSYAYENAAESNERLEFLGDAVLEMVTSHYLYTRFRALSEGDLTKLRAGAVCEQSLSRAARVLGLGAVLRLGKGEEATGGRTRDSILADALEAVIGAVFLDGGLEQARRVIEHLLADYISQLHTMNGFGDHKTSLQEILQRDSQEKISYLIIDERGPDHQKVFSAEVRHGGTLLGQGEGKTKKEAEQQAARAALAARAANAALGQVGV